MHHKGVAHAAEQTMPFTKASLPPSISDEKLERDIEICQRAMQVCLLPRPQGRRTRCDARPTHGARAWLTGGRTGSLASCLSPCSTRFRPPSTRLAPSARLQESPRATTLTRRRLPKVSLCSCVRARAHECACVYALARARWACIQGYARDPICKDVHEMQQTAPACAHTRAHRAIARRV